MPIRENEKFCEHFVADTPAEAEKLLTEYDSTLKILSNKASNITGLDKEDLYQEGIIGLARASRDFDGNRSSNFKIFAIYKIKDAMREFATTQTLSIKVPQYTKDTMRLASILRGYLIKAGEYRYKALSDMWDSSKKYTGTDPLDKAIQQTRLRLLNLAERSHTSVKQLLERSEITPFFVIDASGWNEIFSKDYRAEEEELIEKLHRNDIIEHIKNHLSEREYALLVNRYIKGMTVRELAPLMGISAPHVSDITQALLLKLRKLENHLINKRELYNESSTDIERNES